MSDDTRVLVELDKLDARAPLRRRLARLAEALYAQQHAGHLPDGVGYIAPDVARGIATQQVRGLAGLADDLRREVQVRGGAVPDSND